MPEDFVYQGSPFFIGCGFAIRRQLFEEIGWYPGNFFIYQNEIDVAFKVRLQGYEIYYDPEAVVVHRGVPSQRPGWRCVYYPTRNTIWIIQKYYPQPMAAYMLLSRILIGFGRAVYLGQMTAFFRALKHGFAEVIDKHTLPPEIRSVSRKFFKQNSILHQIFKRT